MSARLIPPPQLHLHRITQYSQKHADTTLLRAPSELSENRTEASVRTVLGRALVRRRKQRCAKRAAGPELRRNTKTRELKHALKLKELVCVLMSGRIRKDPVRAVGGRAQESAACL